MEGGSLSESIPNICQFTDSTNSTILTILTISTNSPLRACPYGSGFPLLLRSHHLSPACGVSVSIPHAGTNKLFECLNGFDKSRARRPVPKPYEGWCSLIDTSAVKYSFPFPFKEWRNHRRVTEACYFLREGQQWKARNAVRTCNGQPGP